MIHGATWLNSKKIPASLCKLLRSPTMQRTSVMAAHWWHLHHMCGNKHNISDWETPTWLIKNAIPLRLWSGTVQTEGSRCRFSSAGYRGLSDAAGRGAPRAARLPDTKRGSGMEAEYVQYCRWDTRLSLLHYVAISTPVGRLSYLVSILALNGFSVRLR